MKEASLLTLRTPTLISPPRLPTIAQIFNITWNIATPRFDHYFILFSISSIRWNFSRHHFWMAWVRLKYLVIPIQKEFANANNPNLKTIKCVGVTFVPIQTTILIVIDWWGSCFHFQKRMLDFSDFWHLLMIRGFIQSFFMFYQCIPSMSAHKRKFLGFAKHLKLSKDWL